MPGGVRASGGGAREVFRRGCGGDEALRREVESLLVQAEAASSFLETPVLTAAAHAMGAAKPTLAAGQQVASTPYSRARVRRHGEVYRARDTTLGREVAIKVLPSLFTNDSERLARFEREARLLASLNHPNIATIHGIEHMGGFTRWCSNSSKARVSTSGCSRARREFEWDCRRPRP